MVTWSAVAPACLFIIAGSRAACYMILLSFLWPHCVLTSVGTFLRSDICPVVHLPICLPGYV